MSGAPGRVLRRVFLTLLAALGALLFVVNFLPLFSLPLHVAWVLLIGWALYLRDTLPRVALNREALGIALGCLTGLALGGHAFLRWLYASWGVEGEPRPTRVWQARWTAALLGLVLLTFASVIAAAGIVHQTAWLARAPIVTSSFQRGPQRRTMSSLRSIGTAVESYQVDHGFLPEVGDGTVDALRPYLEPTYIRGLVERDAWGEPFHWRHWPGTAHYTLVSTGKDGQGESLLPPAGATTSFNRDIYFSDGQFTLYPEGTQEG